MERTTALETARLDDNWRKLVTDFADKLDQEWRVGSTNSDINIQRYINVAEMLRRHGREMRAEIEELLTVIPPL